MSVLYMYGTSGKGLTPVLCNKLHHAEIIAEQNPSKIVFKNISTDGEVMLKNSGFFLSGTRCSNFLPLDASAERGDATVSRLSVCLSVRNDQVP